MNKVYLLISPKTGRIFYVGITKRTLEARKEQHIYDAKNGCGDNKLKSLRIKSLNYEFLIVLVCSFKCKTDAIKMEKELIESLFNNRVNLTNMMYCERKRQSIGKKPFKNKNINRN